MKNLFALMFGFNVEGVGQRWEYVEWKKEGGKKKLRGTIPTNYEWFLALLIYGSVGATLNVHRIKDFEYNKNLIQKQKHPRNILKTV